MNATAAAAPAPASPAAARSHRQVEWQRRLATVRVVERALGQCFAARAGIWLARFSGVGFVLGALYTSGLAPGALDAVLRLTLLALSGCAGLVALSAAGPAPARILESARGLFEARAVPLEQLRAARPFAVACCILRPIGLVALLVSLACLALTHEPRAAAGVLGLVAGAAVYLLLLAGGLALLAQLCHVLGRSRGQLLLVALVVLPELLAPAWPELPGVVSSYQRLLDRCLGVESRS